MKSALLLGRWCWAASILSMAVIGNQSAAEEATSSSDGPAALQEIVVTAQRRSENIQHAALAVDVVSTEALRLSGASRASDLPNAVPALQVGEFGNGQQSLYIR